MNNINIALAINLKFDNPWFLLVLIPGVILAFWPYFRIRKDKRRTRNRIVSMILHLIILTLAAFVLSGFTIREEGKPKFNETFILIDVSDSNYGNKDELVNYLNDEVLEQVPANQDVGIIVFGAGAPEIVHPLGKKPSISKADMDSFYTNPFGSEEGFLMNEGTDIAAALNFAAKSFTKKSGGDLTGNRVVIFTDGIETDGDAAAVASSLGSRGLRIDAIYFEPVDYTTSHDMLITNLELSTQAPKPGQSVTVTTTIKSHIAGSNVKAYLKLEAIKDGKSETLVENQEVILNKQEVPVASDIKFTNDHGGVYAIKASITSESEKEEADAKDKNGKLIKEVDENNLYYSYVVVQEKTNKILIIKNPSADVTNFQKLIDEKDVGSSGYEVTVTTPAKAPYELSDYGEVVLVDVDTTTFPDGYDSTIKTYVENGGGLLTTGGNNTYYNGGMATNAFKDVLPVSVRPSPKDGKAIVICIDYSSGMVGKDGGVNKMQYIIQGMQKALYSNAFGSDTQIGILFFGGKIASSHPNPVVALDLTDSTKVIDIENAILSKPNDKGYMSNTEWRLPMEKAAEMLNSSSATTKHIIFITDGAPKSDGNSGETSKIPSHPNGSWKQYNSKPGTAVSDPNKNYPAYMYDNFGITLSSVACYVTQDGGYANTIKYVEQMSDDIVGGHGNFYNINDPESLVSLMEDECRNMPTKLVNAQKDYTVELADSLSATTKVQNADLPTINYYNGATTKTDRDAYNLMTVKSEAGDDDPIYAEWKYGDGTVGSIMTSITTFKMDVTDNKLNTTKTIDVNKDFLQDAETNKILKTLVDRCFNSGVSGLTSDMRVTFEQDNFTTNITVSDITNANLVTIQDGSTKLVEGAGIESYYHSPGSKIDPSKDASADALCPSDAEDYQYDDMSVADSSFSSSFSMMDEGLYTVAFLRFSDAGPIELSRVPYSYVTFSYSEEYDTFRDNTGARQNLEEMASYTGGELILPTADSEMNPFSEEYTTISSEFNPVVVFMVIALILFILDVCARKFNFKWPHEWFKKKDKAEAQA